MKSKLDCRTFTFSKWILPKTMSNYSLEEMDALTIGYFDFVKVSKVNLDCACNSIKDSTKPNEHPLEKYIKNKEKQEAEKLKQHSNTNSDLEYTSQQLFAFTNVGVENLNCGIYDEQKLLGFWESPSLIKYYSLLHIEGVNSKETIYETLNNIHNCFHQGENSEEYSAICYFSLDYSDIVICAKDISIGEYSKRIFNINFNNSEKKIIRDSFSLLCIDYGFSNSVFHIIEQNKALTLSQYRDLISEYIENSKYVNSYGVLNEQFNVSFNIGVQNYETFKKLSQIIEEKKLLTNGLQYKMLGRHDVTIINEQADIVWLVVMQSILDYFSTEYNQINDKILDIKSIMFNCESYIRISFDEKNEISKYKDVSLATKKEEINKPKYYKNAKKILDEEIKELLKNIDEQYLVPVCTLRNSILGLLKNGFADDFVLCVFKSFVDFLKYINKKVQQNENYCKMFDSCFDKYFDNVDCLINSAMHSDRQFIQSPSFNPVFYDVPPKLMAYYTAIMNKIYMIIRTDEDNSSYSFMFRPSFCKDIRLDTYSYNERPPVDRLLAITINEKSLYYPNVVISQLCHEIAHCVGDGNRCRIGRKERFLKCVLFYIAYDYIKKFILLDDYETKISLWVKNTFHAVENSFLYKNVSDYSSSFNDLIYQVLYSICLNQEIYINNRILFPATNEEDDIGFEQFNDKFRNYLYQELSSLAFSQNNKITNVTNLITSVFSETYADLQMIIILNLSCKEYLEKFVTFFNQKNEKCFERTIHSYSDVYYRVLNVFMLLLFVGFWKVDSSSSNSLEMFLYQDIKSFVDYLGGKSVSDSISKFYKNDVTGIIEKISLYNSSDWKCFNYWNINIQNYLVEVYYKSCNNYNSLEKEEYIKELRKKRNTIKSFNDAVEVFYNIKKTNDDFAKNIYRQ